MVNTQLYSLCLVPSLRNPSCLEAQSCLASWELNPRPRQRCRMSRALHSWGSWLWCCLCRVFVVAVLPWLGSIPPSPLPFSLLSLDCSCTSQGWSWASQKWEFRVMSWWLEALGTVREAPEVKWGIWRAGNTGGCYCTWRWADGRQKKDDSQGHK